MVVMRDNDDSGDGELTERPLLTYVYTPPRRVYRVLDDASRIIGQLLPDDIARNSIKSHITRVALYMGVIIFIYFSAFVLSVSLFLNLLIAKNTE